jgi:hypothetical protein
VGTVGIINQPASEPCESMMYGFASVVVQCALCADVDETVAQITM